MNHNYKLTIAYDGTAYAGWQIQPNGLTIQEILQQKIAIILSHEVNVIGSGRTDSGVHALAQTANFLFHNPIDLFRFKGSLNALLPKDIRINDIVEVPTNFHAQYSALGKIYHYHLHLDRVENPFSRLYRWHLPTKIDTHLLKLATKPFIGTHDFTSFANEASAGCAAHDPIRNIKRIDVVDQPGGLRLEFEGDGFLYKMVRNITGTLIEVANGKRPLSDIEKILNAKDRRQAGQTAPPQGLFLVEVQYPIIT